MLDGYQPGDPVVRVFAYQASPGRSAEEIAEEAFAIFNDHPGDAAGAELACAYYGRRLRSLSVGDVVAVGDVAAGGRRPAGWEPVTGPLTEVRTREHGTSPLPLPGRAPGSGPAPRPGRRTTVNEKKTVTVRRACRSRVSRSPAGSWPSRSAGSTRRPPPGGCASTRLAGTRCRRRARRRRRRGRAGRATRWIVRACDPGSAARRTGSAAAERRRLSRPAARACVGR